MTLWTASSMFCGTFNVGPSFLSRSGAYVHVYYALVRLLGSWIGFPMSISLSGEPSSGGIAQLFRPGLVSELLAHVFVPGNGSDIAQVKRLNCLSELFLGFVVPWRIKRNGFASGSGTKGKKCVFRQTARFQRFF